MGAARSAIVSCFGSGVGGAVTALSVAVACSGGRLLSPGVAGGAGVDGLNTSCP